LTRPARPSRPWPERVPAHRELLDRLNREWRITSADAAPSLRQRLARPLRLAFAALLRPQETFNSAVVQQLNQLDRANDAAAERDETLRAMLEDIFFRTEVLFDHVEARGDIGIARLEADLDAVRRSAEAFGARDRRLEAGVLGLQERQDELRTVLSVLQHEITQLTRLVRADPAAAASRPATTALAGSAASPASSLPTVPGHALSHKYVGFEDAFRGSSEAIRAGLAAYVPLFAGATDVLDVGCGRGEFLALLREAGISSRGIDLNETMVDVCRQRGLDAEAADALQYLRGLPDESLGGLFAAQVVEHLQPGYLTQLLDAAFSKLRPGAPIVLETINPACWFAFFSSYIRDITHERPLHPDTLKFLLVASGFQQVDIRYSSPYPEHEKLQAVGAGAIAADAAETLNANVEKINSLLFTYLDYAAIGRK
jgi:2-polyprenyl-3-methyl-5-hydroxy-6-metoxy-1,4-benzoquinol methylase